ncbi:hypothetical protein BT246_68180 (plasmid) [Bacillus thuringiensis]|uniref:Uncharacterized protein n=1 Tax=Bacillus thuringiensis TaxID=1428 RepID=A0A9W3X4D6_BACTU|nr:hypothetical protein BT246_68180 [Bacillus thuringiensis]
MNKGDAILRLLSEIKLELKGVKEQVEQMQTKLDTFEQQNQVKNKVEQKKPKQKTNIKRNYSASSRRLFSFTSLICTFCVNTRYIIQGGGIYVEKTRNSSCLSKGTSSYLRFCSSIRKSNTEFKRAYRRIRKSFKKTLQIVINHPLQMVFVSLLQKVCENHPSVKPVASWATKDIHFI